jgi:hypothetical protein
MANKSIETIQSLIDQAQANLEGVVQWQGEGGEQEILTAMNDNTCARGIMLFPDTTSMSKAGSNDSGYAICNTASGYSLYAHFPNRLSAIDSISSPNGEWRLVSSVPSSTSYWELSTDNNSLIPTLLSKPVVIGADAAIEDGVIFKVASIGKAAMMPVLTTSEMNSIATAKGGMMIVNNQDNMVLFNTGAAGDTIFRSVGGYSFSVTTTVSSATYMDVTIPNATMHATDYKVQMTAASTRAGAEIANGCWISNKGTSSFRVNFNGSTSGVMSFDFQISH